MPLPQEFLHFLDNSPNDLRPALSALKQMTPEMRGGAVSILIEMLKRPGGERQKDASYLLSHCELDEGQIIHLAKALQDPNRDVQFSAARALVRSDSRALPALQLLIEAFAEDAPIRDSAAWAASNIALPAVPTLLELLKNGPMPHRALAAGILGEIGCRSYQTASEETAKLFQPLAEALKDPEAYVRRNSLIALENLHATILVPCLLGLLEAEGGEYREIASLHLAWLSPRFPSRSIVETALRKVLDDSSHSVRHFAEEALRRLAPKSPQ